MNDSTYRTATPRSEIREQPCPSCGVTIPVDYGYVVWCDRCDWNLEPSTADPPRTLFEKIQATLGDRMSDRLFESVMRADTLAPRLTLSRAAANVLAALVHGVTVFFVALGIALLAWGWPHVGAIIAGVLCLATALATRPRLGRFPKKFVASRQEYPAFYKLADDMARSLGTSPVDAIVFTAERSAWIMQVGLRRRKVMGLGIPLLAMLNEQERIALIGHELGHTVNGDCTRGLVIGSAMATLSVWYMLVRPESLVGDYPGMVGVLMVPVNIILYGIAGLIGWTIHGFVLLLHHDSQRAEYLADYLAAEAAGTEAKLALLAKLQLRTIYEYSIQRASTNPGRGVFAELEHQMAILPQREMERLSRVGLLERSRLDSTHPPTSKRIGFLASRHRGEPRIVPTAEESAALASELASFYPGIEQALTEQYMRNLYQ